MAAPYPLLIRKTANDGTTTTVINTETTFGMVVSEVPFHFAGSTKEPYSNNWKDEEGKEVYLPDSGLLLESYDMEVTFLYKGSYNSLSTNLRNFTDYLRGKDREGSRLAIYDTYNGVGRKDVYVKSISPDIHVKQKVSNSVGEEIAKFSITFEVCDPDTDIILTL